MSFLNTRTPWIEGFVMTNFIIIPSASVAYG